jgi:hypothetical protein
MKVGYREILNDSSIKCTNKEKSYECKDVLTKAKTNWRIGELIKKEYYVDNVVLFEESSECVRNAIFDKDLVLGQYSSAMFGFSLSFMSIISILTAIY